MDTTVTTVTTVTTALTQALTKLAYQSLQYSKSAVGITHKNWTSRIRNVVAPLNNGAEKPFPPDVLAAYRQRYDQLLALDWADMESGVYELSLLFDTPWTDILQFYPQILLDLPQTWSRSKNKEFKEFRDDIFTDGYPQYYVQNFHHQTDGYLSDESANLYDLQVELLFNGAADPMRRRILPPLKQHLMQIGQFENTLEERNTRVLDIACGTGRTLRMLRGTIPMHPSLELIYRRLIYVKPTSFCPKSLANCPS